MKKIKVCLTGATGHVGYATLKELQKYDDRDIRIIVRKDPGIFEDMRCEICKGDILDYESLIRAFEGVDIVYHIAGCVEVKNGNEENVYNINVNGTKNVIRACRKMGVRRLVYMSSVDTYVPLPDNEVMHEVYHYNPDELEGTYAKTKAEATQAVLDANGKGGLETVVCQPSACMGPYDFKVSMVGSMIRMFSTGKFPVTMTFGGYNFVDVRDVAIGTVLAGDKAKPGEVFILCNESCTVDEFIRLLAEASGNKPPKIKLHKGLVGIAAPLCEAYYKAADKPALFTRYAIRKLCSNCNFSYEKAMVELGYHPRPLLESLKDTLVWIKENEEREAKKAAEKEQKQKEAELLAEAKRLAELEREEKEAAAFEERLAAEKDAEKAEKRLAKEEKKAEKAAAKKEKEAAKAERTSAAKEKPDDREEK